jgi:hypothetical protein
LRIISNWFARDPQEKSGFVPDARIAGFAELDAAISSIASKAD